LSAVRDLNLQRATDPEIFAAARGANVIVLTKDADFVELLEKHGPPPQVVLVTCGNTSNARLLSVALRRCPYAEQHLFERRSVAHDHELLAEALRHGRGRIALEETKDVLGLEASAGAILRVGHQVATRESLDRERQMIAAIASNR
jgi:predicted nuclease of predicted toxin-antitoxin system